MQNTQTENIAKKEYKKIPASIKAEAFQLYNQDKNEDNLTPSQQNRLIYLIETYQIKYKSFYNWSKAGGVTKKWTKEKRSGRKAQEKDFEEDLLQFIQKKKEACQKEEGYLVKYELDDEIEKKLKMGAYQGFKASNGWRNKFFKRHGINPKTIYSSVKRNKKEKALAKKIIKNLIEEKLQETTGKEKFQSEIVQQEEKINNVPQYFENQTKEPEIAQEVEDLSDKNFFYDQGSYQNYEEAIRNPQNEGIYNKNVTMESDNYLIDQNYFLNNEMNIQNVNNEPFNLAQYFEEPNNQDNDVIPKNYSVDQDFFNPDCFSNGYWFHE